MQPDDRNLALLADMLEACRNARQIAGEAAFEDLMEDLKLRLAVERCLEIVGEAAGRVTMEFQQAHPEIPWRQVKGMRNILTHDYGRIDYEIIFVTVREEVPKLLAVLERLVAGAA